MMKTEVLAPEPKKDSNRKAPEPPRWQKDAPERATPEGDDRWAHMPCTD